MRKELIWAGIIGITFGLIIAFGAWRINSSLKPNSPIATMTPPPDRPEEENISLDKPENDDVITSNTVTVSGITKPQSLLVVSGEVGDYIIQSDNGGIFAQDVDLNPGVNQIKVTLLSKNGNQTFQKVLVVYSASFQLNSTSSPSPSLSPSSTPGTATGEADIQKTIDQEVATASQKPKAYLGTVTDISDSTIQMKTMDSQIAQVADSNPGVTVANQVGTNNKAVKVTDIAIGDFIVSMGYVNSNSVLTAQRILVTDAVAEPKIDISMSKVTAVSKKSLTAADIKSGGSTTLTPDKNTDLESYSNGKETGIKLSSISVNDIVISITDDTGTPAILRSVFDIGS